ncbi:NADPH:quinone oxidoreductase family protein [Plastorhodobacter daqingensis]|uniref:NADPH:quinone oxidoreductase family protein n=1 Tax=Plastorhodobacter daqingensis TaxID=1387281 RepID=A0ABW2URU3_9RHOB
MRSYRVWEVGSPNNLKLDAIGDLTPAEGEVVVDVEVAAVGFVDTLVVSGRYQAIPPAPFTPGMEFAGIVRAVGTNVEGCAIGDRVAAYVPGGAFAEQAIAKVGEFYPVPEDIPLDRAVLLSGAYLTAHFALVERGRFEPGETVLVGGAGGAVGLAAVQIAKALGAGKVLGAIRSERDRDAVLAAGADAVVDLAGAELRDAVRDQVFAATGGRGADLVIDPIGGDFFGAALRAMEWRGRLVVVGFAAGEIPTVRANYLLLKNIAVLGLEVGQFRRRAPAAMQAVQAELFDLARRGLLAPRVAREFAFEALPDALEFVAAGRTGGRALVSIGGAR